MKKGRVLVKVFGIALAFVVIGSVFGSTLGIANADIGQHPEAEINVTVCSQGGNAYEINITFKNKGEESAQNPESANGVHVQIAGADINSVDKGSFDEYLTDFSSYPSVYPNEYEVVEFYTNHIGADEECTASLVITVSQGNLATIKYRGWITDKDDTIFNPNVNQNELYIARDPIENASNPNNPPYNQVNNDFTFLDYDGYYLSVYEANPYNTNNDATWIGCGWTYAQSENSIRSLLEKLRAHRIHEIYLNVGGADPNGNFLQLYNPLTKEQIQANCAQFMSVVEDYSVENQYEFQVLAWVNGGGDYIYDITIESVQENIAQFCSEFAGEDVGFNGIQYDYEFWDTYYNDAYLQLLEKIRNAIPTNKVLSVDIVAAWLFSPWSNYVRSLAERVDEVVLMAYDSGRQYESYREWVRVTTNRMFEQSVTTDAEVIIGVPTYDAVTEWHKKGENLAYALLGAMQGANSALQPTVRISIFANWVTGNYDWTVFEVLWHPSAIQGGNPVDVVLIIDSSGSMGSNDPSKERLDAAEAFLTACLPGDQVGVVDFDTTAKLLGAGLYSLPENKDTLSSLIAGIDNSGGSTNMRDAITVSCQELSNDGSAMQRGAILLTDGHHNVGSFGNPQQCFIDNGWPIYTFGFGSADATLLQQIADETGGEYKHISEVFSLLCELQRVRAMIAGVEPPPCIVDHIDPDETATRIVEVPPDQAQATFSSNWLGSDIVMTLTTPSGRVIDRDTVAPDVVHDKGADFEVYTIMNPEAGSWQVDLFGLDVPPGGEDVIFGFVSIPYGSGIGTPVADAGLDQTVERTSAEGAEVTLDCSLSYDPDGDPLTYSWSWAGGSASGVSPTVVMPMGTTVVNLEVSDGALTDIDTVSITVQDTTPPIVTVEFPTADLALQDGATLVATVSDISGVAAVYFYVREPDCPQGQVISPEFEDLSATFNGATGKWEYNFDTLSLPDGNYIVLAKAVDTYGNEGWSDCVHFDIRNWAVIELLPASQNNKAKRTMPIKFSLRVAASVDPSQPFVWNDELTIKIYATDNPGNILQASTFGDGARDYRIDSPGALYITNFKTSKIPMQYTVEIWRTSKNWLVGSFTFETVK